MAATIIDGRALGERIRSGIAQRVGSLRSRGRPVRLDAVLVSDDQESAARVYVDNQRKMCERLGIGYKLHHLPADSSEDDVAGRILLLNSRADVHAIMVHLPLPEGIDAHRIQALIDPRKDVEGVNPANIGNIVYGRSSLAPCTASAVLEMIGDTGVALRGKHAVVVGASDIVGKPIAVMLMRPEATVISVNKFTPDVPALARAADILVACAGVPGLVKGDWIKPGAVVIDVGIHRVPLDPPLPDGTKMRTIGDVDAEAAMERAGFLSPVPGGVGPVTVAMLLKNVIAAAERAPLAASGEEEEGGGKGEDGAGGARGGGAGR
ncbi:MAG: bifunctional 5,10-methylenetetrahydrofolate dehydrogenase/5,10-methenyltetrahydrofolate cyclohydrolase [Phycisphaerales bacterium]